MAWFLSWLTLSDFLALIILPVLIIVATVVYFNYAKEHDNIHTIRDGYVRLVGHSWTHYQQTFTNNNEHDWIRNDILDKHSQHKLLCLAFPFHANHILINNDLRLIKHLFTQHKQHLFVSRAQFDCFRDLLGLSILNCNGDPHTVLRTKAVSFFNPQNLRHFNQIFDAQSLSMVDKVHQYQQKHDAFFSLNEVLFRSFLAAFCLIYVGTDFNLNFSSYPNSPRFLHSFNQCVYYVNLRHYKSYWKILKAIKFGTENVINDAITFMDACITTMCEAKKARLDKVKRLNESLSKHQQTSKLVKHSKKAQKLYMNKKEQAEEDANDDEDDVDESEEVKEAKPVQGIDTKQDNLIDFYLSSDEDIELQLLRDHAFTFLYASRDFVALLISWFFYEITLKENRAVYQKLRAEIVAMKQGYQLSKLKYLEHCLYETLRLHPVKPWIIRQCMSNIQIPRSSQELRKNDLLAIHLYSLGRSEKIWKEALKFNPQRFAKSKELDAYKYIFFGLKDERLCIGQQLGWNAAKIYVFNILKDYDVIAEPGQNITYAPSAMLHMKSGFKCKFVKR